MIKYQIVAPLIMDGLRVVGRILTLPCGHVSFNFKDTRVLFHLNIEPHEHEKMCEMVNALEKIEFDRAAPDMSVPFFYEQCNIDGMIEFKNNLDEFIKAANELIAKIKAEGGNPAMIFSQPNHETNSFVPLVKGVDIKPEKMDEMLKAFGVEGVVRTRKKHTRPLSASESVLGFVEYVINDMTRDGNETNLTPNEISHFRKNLLECAIEFLEENELPRPRAEWRKHCKGI